ncbi:MAG TPA: Holliday junction branch migration protein RuvA [Candidatus Paceibacterota bacterium]|nr:Holliday junction branch migration protein RuvA [Candidatus Paceibacterota bacterium]
MIGQLTGKIAFADNRSIILDVNGVGYKVFISTDTLSKVKADKSVLTFWTHLVVREDVLDLYGFLTRNELDFFGLLISISGVGPRGALSILSLAPPDTLKQAIASGNTAYLTQVSGIGRKIAEKIVLELRDKIGVIESEGTNLDQEAEAIMALEALGYSNREAREALRQIPAEITDTGDKVKRALKNLSSKNHK